MEVGLRATESSGDRFGLPAKLAGKLAMTVKSVNPISAPSRRALKSLNSWIGTRLVILVTCHFERDSRIKVPVKAAGECLIEVTARGFGSKPGWI